MTTPAEAPRDGGQRVVLVEGNPSGHRLSYVRVLAEAALGRGDSVTLVTSSDAVADGRFEAHLGRLRERMTVMTHDGFDLTSLAKLTDAIGPTITVVPDGDAIAVELARTGRWNGAGRLSLLIMREKAQRQRFPNMTPVRSAIKTLILLRASRVGRVHLVVLKSAVWTGRSRFVTARDPIEVSYNSDLAEDLQTDWSLESSKYWFGVLGAITPRKNLELVLKSLLAFPDLSGVGILVAGRCDPDVVARSKDLIDRLRLRGALVVVQNRLLSDAELDNAISVIDCVVIAHSNEGPSGLFGKSVALGTRVVTAGAASLRMDSGSFPASASWSRLTVEALSTALSRARESNRPSRNGDLGTVDFCDPLLLPCRVQGE
jgi:hypothetical protein